MQKPLFERVAGGVTVAVRNWLKTRALRAELRSLPDREFGRLRAETGLTEHDIEHMVAGHPGPTTLLPKRLAGLGIDPQTLEAAQPALYRDLERVCAKCGNTRPCQRDLATGDLAVGQQNYCLNAYTIKSLLADDAQGGGPTEACAAGRGV
jgi:hypothetical protein